jgi:hypothetical protein
MSRSKSSRTLLTRYTNTLIITLHKFIELTRSKKELRIIAWHKLLKRIILSSKGVLDRLALAAPICKRLHSPFSDYRV